MTMIYDLKTYVSAPGRLDDVLARFRQPVLQIWEELGIEPLGFWTAESGERGELVYLLRWDSERKRDEKMAAFLKDPRWLDAKAHSECDGPIVESFATKPLRPTDFSRLR
jgi:hypothetical protein